MSSTRAFLMAVTILVLGVSTIHADPVLFVHDSSGNLGTVDVPTGTVNVIGNMGVVLTDIAFDPNGNLFGLSFTQLYRINPMTANTTVIGAHGIDQGNALVFSADGTLYGAGADTTSLFTLNVMTGAGTSIGNIGFRSAGDLAFNAGSFFLSSLTNELIRIDLTGGATGTPVGAFGFTNVFGLATAENGVLYGVAGTSIFSVDTSTGAGTLVSNYGGRGLGTAAGSSFFREAIPPEPLPEPATILLLGTGLAVVAGVRRWRKAGK